MRCCYSEFHALCDRFDNKLRFSKQVVLSLRLYDKEIITLVSLGIGSIMYWE